MGYIIARKYNKHIADFKVNLNFNEPNSAVESLIIFVYALFVFEANDGEWANRILRGDIMKRLGQSVVGPLCNTVLYNFLINAYLIR